MKIPPSAKAMLAHPYQSNQGPPEIRREKWTQSRLPNRQAPKFSSPKLSLVSPEPVCCRTAMENPLGIDGSVWAVVPDGACKGGAHG